MYIIVSNPKEQFNVNGKSLGLSKARALYYSTDVGRHRIYRSAMPLQPYLFKGVDVNKKLKLLKYKSKSYAQKVCDEINEVYDDNFYVKEEN